MSGKRISALLSAVAAAALLNAGGTQAQNGVALTGTVSSAAEGAMEGVLVSAKKDGGNITITVVSDDKGHYAFPADRLEPGHYNIKIRATGYISENRPAADVAPGKTATVDLKLGKTDNIAPQLTSAEWLASMPGTDEQKAFLQDCTTCHTPHGTQNPRLLNMPSIATLCNQCHSPVSAGGVHGLDAGSTTVTPCVTCHTMIHGSNASQAFIR